MMTAWMRLLILISLLFELGRPLAPFSSSRSTRPQTDRVLKLNDLSDSDPCYVISTKPGESYISYATPSSPDDADDESLSHNPPSLLPTHPQAQHGLRVLYTIGSLRWDRAPSPIVPQATPPPIV